MLLSSLSEKRFYIMVKKKLSKYKDLEIPRDYIRKNARNPSSYSTLGVIKEGTGLISPSETFQAMLPLGNPVRKSMLIPHAIF